jgi:hypothetical protein
MERKMSGLDLIELKQLTKSIKEAEEEDLIDQIELIS